MSWCRPLLVFVLLPGCGPDSMESAEFARVCGEDGPVRILETGGQRILSSPLQRSVIDGDRFVVEAGRLDFSGSDALPEATDRQIWSVGPCGESPVLIAEGLRLEFAYEPWADAIVACGPEYEDLYVLDPSGESAPALVFPGVSCAAPWTDHGIVNVHERPDDLGVIELFAYPEDPWAGPVSPTLLYDGAQRHTPDLPHGADSKVPVALDHEVFALTPDNVLIRIELPGAETTPIAGDVFAFRASEELVVWQELESLGTRSDHQIGRVVALDRTTQSEAYLLDTALAFSFRPVLKDGLALRTDALRRGEERVFNGLSAADYDAIDGAEQFIGRLGDRRWLVGGIWNGPFRIEDFGSGERTSVFEGEGTRLDWDGYDFSDGITVHEAPQCCIDKDSWLSEGPVWHLPYDGEPALLANRATRHPVRWPDGRTTTRIGVGADHLGQLVVIDPDTLAEAFVDADVYRDHTVVPQWEDDVFYWVDDGERSGLWRARLVP